jgi:ABC-type sugar transport system permease subunit
MTKTVGQRAWVPYLFLSPFLLTFAVFLAYPLLDSALLAGSQTYGPSHSVWVGWGNFRHMFADPDFWTALENTAVYTVCSVGLQLPLSLLLALVLNQPGLRGRTLFRLIFFLPALVGTVFVAMMFGILLGDREGLVNAFLRAVVPGFPPVFPWLRRAPLRHRQSPAFRTALRPARRPRPGPARPHPRHVPLPKWF